MQELTYPHILESETCLGSAMAPNAYPGKREASNTESKQVEEEELTPYVIVGEINIGKRSFATVYKGYHK